MKNTLISILMAGVLALGLTACTPDVPTSGDQPAPQASHSGSDMLMGGLMGYLLGSSGSRSSPSTTHVVERTVVKEVPVKPVVSEQPKLHSGQPVAKPTTNTYSTPSRNAYSSPSRSFSSGRR